MVSKTRKYIDFDICGLQDRYIGLPDGLGIESPLIIRESLWLSMKMNLTFRI